jgi:hypothetical protein
MDDKSSTAATPAEQGSSEVPASSSNSQHSTPTAEKNDVQAVVLEAQTLKDKIGNPLAGFTRDQLMADVENFANQKGLMDSLDDLKKGALVAQNPTNFENIPELTEADKGYLRLETTNKWKQPVMMYFMTSK